MMECLREILTTTRHCSARLPKRRAQGRLEALPCGSPELDLIRCLRSWTQNIPRRTEKLCAICTCRIRKLMISMFLINAGIANSFFA